MTVGGGGGGGGGGLAQYKARGLTASLKKIKFQRAYRPGPNRAASLI